MASAFASLFVGTWAIGVAAATLVLPTYLNPSVEPRDAAVTGLTTVTQPVLAAAPIVGAVSVDGFLIMSIAAELSSKSPPDVERYETILHDAYLSVVLEQPEKYSAGTIANFPFEEFKRDLTHAIEAASGEWEVAALYLSQVNFVPKDQARNKTRLRRLAIPTE